MSKEYIGTYHDEDHFCYDYIEENYQLDDMILNHINYEEIWNSLERDKDYSSVIEDHDTCHIFKTVY